mgnify:CR=1 FL=1|jgi:hypothetical protein
MNRRLAPLLHIQHYSTFRLSLIAILVGTLFSSVTSAEYIYDKDHQQLDNKSLLVYNNPVVNEQFTINTADFDPKVSSALYVRANNNVLVKDSQFKLQLGKALPTEFYSVDIEGNSSSSPLNGFTAQKNIFYFEGNDSTPLSKNLQSIHIRNVNGVAIHNNRILISELEASSMVSGVSTLDSSGVIQGNYLSITDSSIKNIRGVTNGSTLRNDEEKGLNIKDNLTIINNTSFNEARGAYMSGARYDSVLDGNRLVVINPIVNAKFGASVIIAQDLGMGVYDISSSGVINGVLLLTGKMVVDSANQDNQHIEIGAGRSMISGVRNNHLIIQNFDAEFSDRIIYWQTFGGWGEDGNAEMNKVTFDNARFSGGEFIYGGISENGTASGNGIEIKNGSQVEGELVGAFAGGEKVTNAYVTIDDSKVIGTISLFSGSKKNTKFGSGTLTVLGSSDLSQAVLQPYNLKRFNNTDTGLKGYTGQTDVSFVADGFSGVIKQLGSVDEMAAFDHVSLLNQKWDREGAILTISDSVAFKRTSLSNNSLSFIDSEAVAKGGTITLLESDNGISYVDPEESEHKELISTAGTALEFVGTVKFENQKITYSIDSIESAEQTILVGDSRLATTAFINQGSDLLERVFHGFTLSRDKYGLMTFATAEGTKGDYDLSNPIKVNGWNFIAGSRSVSAVAYGDLISAAFVEYGEGNYRATNTHLGYDFRTDGNMRYMGAGLAVRFMTASDLYLEGSVRSGQIKSDLDRALMDAAGHYYDADTDSIYAGLHLGVGFITYPMAGMELDSYAKYFFTYTDSDSFKIDSLNEKYEFDSITSHRLRLGTRASWNRDNVTFMFGLAGEYEFDAQSDMIAAGASARTSELDGFSAFAEAGMSLKPSVSSPWQFDLQVRGWEGTRDAVSGMATVNYLF